MEQMLTFNDVCKLFGVSRPTLYSWIKRGDIPNPIRMGRRMFFSPGSIRSAVEKRSDRT
jgi:excisionase family DNA binding protein